MEWSLVRFCIRIYMYPTLKINKNIRVAKGSLGREDGAEHVRASSRCGNGNKLGALISPYQAIDNQTCGSILNHVPFEVGVAW